MLNLLAAIRIDASNPIGAVIIAIIITAATAGLVYGLLNWLVEKVILPIMKVPEDDRDDHILGKIVLIITGLVLLAGIVMLILPASGVDTGPLNLVTMLGY